MKGPTITTCLYLIYFIVGQAAEKISYTGNQLWKITNDNNSTLNLLKTLEQDNYVSIWGHNSRDIDAMIHSSALNKVRDKLQENGQKFVVSIKNIQRAIDEENPKPSNLDGRKGYRLTWNYYHSLADIYDFLYYLQETFPKLCSVHNIGQSVEGRPIKLFIISNRKKANKAIFIEGGINAREWISPAVVTYIINQFVSNYQNETLSEKNIDWYIVPVLNPDGYEYSYNVDRLWKKNRSKNKNCIGVDLSRNWGYNWGKNGSSSDPCSNSYRGRRPFSEHETAIVANVFITHPEIDWIGYIAVHAYGQYIVYPWGCPNGVLEDNQELNRVAKEAALKMVSTGGESYTVGPAGITTESSSGISIGWAKDAQAIKYAYTMKLRDTGRYGYILPARFIKPTSEEAVTFLKTIAGIIKS